MHILVESSKGAINCLYMHAHHRHHPRPYARLACCAASEDELPDSPSSPQQQSELKQQQQPAEQTQPSPSSLNRQEDSHQPAAHSESAQQQDPQAQQQPSARYSPEQQLLKTAMKKLQALEAYQQLLSTSSGPAEKQLQRRAGDSPAEVSAKIAANKDEVPLLDAAILIAQVRTSGQWSGSQR